MQFLYNSISSSLFCNANANFHNMLALDIRTENRKFFAFIYKTVGTPVSILCDLHLCTFWTILISLKNFLLLQGFRSHSFLKSRDDHWMCKLRSASLTEIMRKRAQKCRVKVMQTVYYLRLKLKCTSHNVRQSHCRDLQRFG